MEGARGVGADLWEVARKHNVCAEGERKQARPSLEILKGLMEPAAGAWGFDLALPAPRRVRSGWPQPRPTVTCDSLTPAST